MPNEAQSRSAYAENPSYPNAYPSQSYAPQPAYVEPKKPVYASQQHYAAPAPAHTYSYPSPAPQVVSDHLICFFFCIFLQTISTIFQ